MIVDKRVGGTPVAPPPRQTSFSKLENGVLKIEWKNVTHRIDLRRDDPAPANGP